MSTRKVCDSCGKVLQDGEKHVRVWVEVEPSLHPARFRHFCKGECADVALEILSTMGQTKYAVDSILDLKEKL